MKRWFLAVVLLVAACSSSTSAPPHDLTVASPSFVDGAEIPDGFTCTGGSEVPAITWKGNLHKAAALAVVVDDPDATFTHRIVLDLPPTTTTLAADVPSGAHQANNSAGKVGWTPPCPPSGTHHYRFTVYGLSKATALPDGTPPDNALKAITSTAVVEGRLTGLVKHQPNK